MSDLRSNAAASSSSSAPAVAPSAGPASDPRAQARYQVRLDWGVPGAARIAHGADATIWVDQLGGPDAATPVATTDFLVRGSLQTAKAIAQWVLLRQEERGGRFVVSVVAAGGSPAAAGAPGFAGAAGFTNAAGPSDAAEPRFTVDDLFAAGAVVSALTDVGLDHASPEAAAAAAAYLGLKSGLKHLVKNSVSGVEQGLRELDLREVDAVEVLRAPATD